jgi:hypothetical protein
MDLVEQARNQLRKGIVQQGRTDATVLPNEVWAMQFANSVFDLFDGAEVNSKVISVLNMQPLTSSEYNVYGEPLTLLRQIGVHTPEKLTLNPYKIAFDAAGQFVVGPDTFDVAEIVDTLGTLTHFGLLLVVNQNDTEIGQSSIDVLKVSSGLRETYTVDPGKTGTFLMVNHSQDQIRNMDILEVPAPPIMQLDTSFTNLPSPQSYFVDFEGPLGYEIRGLNAIVNVYVVPMSRPVVDTVWAAIVRDEIDRMPALAIGKTIDN